MLKLLRSLGKKEIESDISPRYPNERFLTQLTLLDGEQRPFYVKYFFDRAGYALEDKLLSCTDCHEEQAIVRAEVYSGTWEPDGSNFYGPSHIPQPLLAANVLSKT